MPPSLADINTTPEEQAKEYVDRLFRVIARAKARAERVQNDLAGGNATGELIGSLYNYLKELRENDSATLSAALAAGSPTAEQTEIVTLAIAKVSGVSTGAELGSFMTTVITNGEAVNAAIETDAGTDLVTQTKSGSGASARYVDKTYAGGSMPNLTAALTALLGS